MTRRFGPAGGFFSVKPDDVHNPLGIRLTIAHTTNTKFPAMPEDFLRRLREEPERFGADFGIEGSEPSKNLEDLLQRQATRNPASTSMVYQKIMEVMLATLVGTPTSSTKSVPLDERTHGLWGLGLASKLVTEECGNGSHHAHVMCWIAATPDLCTGAALDEQIFAALSAELDKQFCTQLPLSIHVLDCARRGTYGRMHRAEYEEPSEMSVLEQLDDLEAAPVLSSAFMRSVERTAAAKQMHAWDLNHDQVPSPTLPNSALPHRHDPPYLKAHPSTLANIIPSGVLQAAAGEVWLSHGDARRSPGASDQGHQRACHVRFR